MAKHNVLCAYSEVAGKTGGFAALPDGGIYTGHHLIADNCFYFTGGLRGGGAGLVIVPHYNMNDAPCVVVTADANGGKSREHGQVHLLSSAGFDDQEDDYAAAGVWTYGEAKAAALVSVQVLGISVAKVKQALDKYFVRQLGMTDATRIRAGERSVFPDYEPRRSSREKKSVRATPY